MGTEQWIPCGPKDDITDHRSGIATENNNEIQFKKKKYALLIPLHT